MPAVPTGVSVEERQLVRDSALPRRFPQAVGRWRTESSDLARPHHSRPNEPRLFVRCTDHPPSNARLLSEHLATSQSGTSSTCSSRHRPVLTIISLPQSQVTQSMPPAAAFIFPTSNKISLTKRDKSMMVVNLSPSTLKY